MNIALTRIMKAYKGSIRDRLVVTFVLFVTIFVGSTGWFLYRTAKNSMDSQLGDKLVAIAQAVTTQIDSMFIMQLTPGDEATLTYTNVLNKLNKVKEATNVKRVYIFDRENRSLVDTDESVSIGTEYIRLRFDKFELETLWSGNAVHTVLFVGDDRIFYKSGYAPIKVKDSVVAAVGVDTSANFMQAIKKFRRSVVIFALVSIMITIAIGFIFARTITRPIGELVKVAGEIGKGNFDDEIHIHSKDELGYLGNAMESMRKGIIERDNRLRMMLAGVAHEIRNPLGGIEIFAGLLAEDLEGTSKEHVGKIIKEVKNLNEIVTQFLEYARPAEPVKENIMLNLLIDDVYFLLAPEFGKRGVRFKKELESEDTKVYIDPKQIKRVFMNIFKNSLQVMASDGELKIGSQADGDFVRIMVTDNGPGISAENLGKIFDPFFTTKEKGVGLGLSIVKKLVEDNGGQVTVESVLGKYSTFNVFLPKGSVIIQAVQKNEQNIIDRR